MKGFVLFVMFYSFILMLGCINAMCVEERKTVGSVSFPYVLSIFLASSCVFVYLKIRCKNGVVK